MTREGEERAGPGLEFPSRWPQAREPWAKTKLACTSLFAFAFIYAPVLNVSVGFSFYFDSQAVLCVALMGAAALLTTGNFFRIPGPVKTLCLILVSIAAYGLLSALFLSSESGTFHVALRPLRTLITVGGIYAFLLIARSYQVRGLDVHVVESVYIAISAHSALMVLQFFFPEVRDFIYQYTFADQMLKWNQQFRMAGLSMGGGAQISVFQAMGFLILPFVLVRSRSFGSTVLNCLAGAVIFLSIVFSGRSGLIAIVFFFPAALILAATSDRAAGQYRRLLLAGVASLSCLAAIALALSAVERIDTFVGSEFADLYEVAVNRTFQTFLGEDETLTDLQENHLFMPEDARTLVFGNPRLIELDQNNDFRILRSDSGYVRLLFGYGILGSIMNYAFYMVLLRHAWKRRQQHPVSSRVSMLLAVVILFFHIKEIFVFTRIGLSITCLLFLALLLTEDGPLQDLEPGVKRLGERTSAAGPC